MSFSPIAEISHTALLHNVDQLKQLAANSKLMAVVKANAYGHGLLKMAIWLADAGVDGFGLARIEEAMALREAGIGARLVLLEGVFSIEDLEQASAHQLDIVVHDLSQIELIEQRNLAIPLKVWLKIDTGMHRLGIQEDGFQTAYQRLLDCKNVQQPINLMTHFSVADEPSHHETMQQISLFERLTAELPGERTLCNSAGVLAWPQAHQSWVRPGLALYGASPMVNNFAENYQLQPVMTMRSAVLAVRTLKAGQPVGYCQSWRSSKDTRIAVVAMGYGDGYPRHAINGTPVLINGQQYPMVGKVSMDMLTVDIGDDPVAVGDPVVLWGQGLPVEIVAQYAETIPYELLCSTTARVQYRYID